jgi:uncharacterized protein YndB with AHSA1/START domain
MITKKNPSPGRQLKVGDEAVQKATGKNWTQWFALLDKARAQKMVHKDIAAYLHNEVGVSAWWSQMVTVGYEQERGLRVEHERCDGFAISGSKTVAVSVARLFEAFYDAKLRRRWLADAGFTIRKATPCKSLRITWVDGKTRIEVNLYSKGTSKSQVSVQHNKLASSKEAQRMKAYWAEALAGLKDLLEK